MAGSTTKVPADTLSLVPILLDAHVALDAQVAVSRRPRVNFGNQRRRLLDVTGWRVSADHRHVRPNDCIARHNPIDLRQHRRVTVNGIYALVQLGDQTPLQLPMATKRTGTLRDRCSVLQLPIAFLA